MNGYQDDPRFSENDYHTSSGFIPAQRTYTDPAMPQPQEPRRKSGGGKRAFVGTLCACVVASSVMGFGGGYLASSLAGNGDTQTTVSTGGGTGTPGAPISTEQNLAAPAAGGNEIMTVSQVVNAVSDSVVEISTTVQTTTIFQQQMTGQAAGSGVIISSDGYIITNNHVVDGGTEITVRLKDGTSYPAKLVGTDEQTDVAVVKVDATGLKAAALGSSESLQVGDDAIAIGNPLGELGGTVTNGIISATSRTLTIEDQTMTLLQTNAAINPGNSGGGLFNNKGELIGIVVAKSAGSGVEGLGFAIPIDTAYSVAQDLMANGYVTGRGELGVSIIDISDPQTAFMYRLPGVGVYVASVQDGSAAQAAKLQVGDGIVSVNGEAVSSSAELKAQLEKHKAGETVELEILRDGAKQTASVTLQESIPESVKQRTAAL